MSSKRIPANELEGLAPALGLKHPKGYKKPKLYVDVTTRCVGMEKHYPIEHVYVALEHGKKNPRARKLPKNAVCCYEPAYMFKSSLGRASLPFLGFRFEKGKRYRIRAEEL